MAILEATRRCGSDAFVAQRLPAAPTWAGRPRATGVLPGKGTCVRRRTRALGVAGAARAHVQDLDELLRAPDEKVEEAARSGEGVASALTPSDERGCLSGACRQVQRP